MLLKEIQWVSGTISFTIYPSYFLVERAKGHIIYFISRQSRSEFSQILLALGFGLGRVSGPNSLSDMLPTDFPSGSGLPEFLLQASSLGFRPLISAFSCRFLFFLPDFIFREFFDQIPKS
eukprot:CAMPEP_0114987462 /NCGR_PEP_ID=MMETSP0216-20121206/9022_1 /TAXON_ID=223996 /ORGANISM="Protocruzia adherens, Strain Boccale" /LENGTH=119 /DNA_ID=CAMNT_0002350065 /DNA_START=874 /DNA_END=1233 /DNA_ORIENTATION=-